MCEEPKLIQPLKTIHFIQATAPRNQTISIVRPHACLTLHISDRRRVFYNRAKSLPNEYVYIQTYTKYLRTHTQCCAIESSRVLLYKHIYNSQCSV